MKKILYLLIFPLLISALGCGSSSSGPQPVGSDVLRKYALAVDGPPVTISTSLPQRFTEQTWALKETLCREAGYDLSPYAGQDVSLTRLDLVQRYYYSLSLSTVPTDLNGVQGARIIEGDLPLYLWIVAKDQATVCGYVSSADTSDAHHELHQLGALPEFMSANDVRIK